MLDYTILVATAGRYDIESKGNIYVSKYLDADEAIAMSSLVICNGGCGLVYLSLKHGVPVLGLPSNIDQFMMMSRVVNRKAGKIIRTESIKACNLSQIILSLLDGVYRGNAKEIKLLIEQVDYKSVFINTIHEILVEREL